MNIGARLSVMMFLQFFIWGAWYVTVGQYMARIGMGDSIGWAYTVGPIAALISPFFLGIIADRFFATERVLGVMHILGGVLLLFAPQLADMSVDLWTSQASELTAQGIDPAEYSRDAFIVMAHLPFIGVLFLHMLCFMPTLGLTNTLTFHNITDQEKQFPIIRVFGTIGWIAANLVVSLWLGADEESLPLRVAGSAAILLGLYSFTLPHTPPPAAGRKFSAREALGLDSLALLKQPSFSVFILASLLICIPLAAYYAFAPVFINHAGFHDVAASMSLGQMSEILFMLVMPFFFVRLGVKWMLFVGMLAWAVRYGLFSIGAPDGVVWMILLGIALHGICYDFFFVTGFIYVDKKAPVAVRGQAQGFLVLVTQGIGLGLGAPIMQRIVSGFKAENADQLEAEARTLREQSAELAEQGDLAGAEELWNQASQLLLQTHDWQTIWMIPAIAAAAIMILFALLFHDRVVNRQSEVTEGDVAAAATRDEQP